MIFKKKKSFESVKDNTDEIVMNTENFIKNVEKQTSGSDTVTIMLNGEKTHLSQEDYNTLKAQNQSLKLKLKREIKDVTKEYRDAMKKV